MTTMFTPKDLAKAIEQAHDEYIPLIVQEHLGGHEDTFWLFHGTKTDFRDSAHFWVMCIMYEYRRVKADFAMIQRALRMIKAALPDQYEEITPEMFQRTVNEYSNLLTIRNIQHEYSWHGHIGKAMKVSDEWNDVAVIGETESELVAFNWVTGA